MPTTFDISSQDYGMPFNLPGKGVLLRIKNKGVTGSLTVNSGFLIDEKIINNELYGLDNPHYLPFYMFHSQQDYTNTINAVSNNIVNDELLSVGSIGANVPSYVNNHRFIKSFDLRPLSSFDDEMIFFIYFLPYYLGNYNAVLTINWTDNINFVDRVYNISFSGSLIGHISEIDHTEYPEVVFEVDQVSGNNFFEIGG